MKCRVVAIMLTTDSKSLFITTTGYRHWTGAVKNIATSKRKARNEDSRETTKETKLYIPYHLCLLCADAKLIIIITADVVNIIIIMQGN